MVGEVRLWEEGMKTLTLMDYFDVGNWTITV